MKTLFLDNYRGFENTFIPLLDVNFLVGENSTGKTSVLNLLYLLNEIDFWYKQEFNFGSVRLGGFKDIISANSINKKSFSIGYLEFHENVKNSQFHQQITLDGESTSRESKEIEKENNSVFFLEFVEEDGLPIIKTYREINNGKQIELVFFKKQIKVCIEPASIETEFDVEKLFSQWIAKESSTEKRFKVIRGEDIPFSRRNILYRINDLLNLIEKKDNAQDIRNYRKFPSNLVWLAPIRSEPKRTYDGIKIIYKPDGEHTPYLIKNILKGKESAKVFHSFMNKFGLASGLFDDININKFGSDPSSPFELKVLFGDTDLRINSVGYGVSQVLPVVVEVLFRSNNYWFSIQQPEVHLHPKAQAALGDVFWNLATESGKKFFIETHSDFIIDRFRLNYRSTKKRLESQVLFFERKNNANKVTPIKIQNNGDYSQNQPSEFREFFINEDLNLLGL